MLISETRPTELTRFLRGKSSSFLKAKRKNKKKKVKQTNKTSEQEEMSESL